MSGNEASATESAPMSENESPATEQNTMGENVLNDGGVTEETPTENVASSPQPNPWEVAFPGKTPEQVAQILAHTRKWEQRAKENKAAADEVANARTELEQIRAELAEAHAARDAANIHAAKTALLLERGLPADLVENITGATPDELTASADRLAQYMTNKPAPDRSQGQPAPMALNSDALAAAVRAAVGA